MTVRVSLKCTKGHCGECTGCQQPNCGTYAKCLDMKCFGGLEQKRKHVRAKSGQASVQHMQQRLLIHKALQQLVRMCFFTPKYYGKYSDTLVPHLQQQCDIPTCTYIF